MCLCLSQKEFRMQSERFPRESLSVQDICTIKDYNQRVHGGRCDESICVKCCRQVDHMVCEECKSISEIIHTWSKPRGRTRRLPEFLNDNSKMLSVLIPWKLYKRNPSGIDTSGSIYNGYLVSLITNLLLQEHYDVNISCVGDRLHVFDLSNWSSELKCWSEFSMLGLLKVLEELPQNMVVSLFQAASLPTCEEYSGKLWSKEFLKKVFGSEIETAAECFQKRIVTNVLEDESVSEEKKRLVRDAFSDTYDRKGEGDIMGSLDDILLDETFWEICDGLGKSSGREEVPVIEEFPKERRSEAEPSHPPRTCNYNGKHRRSLTLSNLESEVGYKTQRYGCCDMAVSEAVNGRVLTNKTSTVFLSLTRKLLRDKEVRFMNEREQEFYQMVEHQLTDGMFEAFLNVCCQRDFQTNTEMLAYVSEHKLVKSVAECSEFSSQLSPGSGG